MLEKKPKTAAEWQLMNEFPPKPENLVTLANFSEGPPVRWSFMHVSELIPCAEAHRGYRPIYEIPVRKQDINHIEFIDIEQKQSSIGKILEQTYTDGLLVIHHNKIISEQYFNDMKPHSRHLLQSVSKSLTSVLAGIFIEKGELSLNALNSHYLPELKDSAYGDATLQQLLDMTVAVEYLEDYGNPDADVTRHEIAAGWRVRTNASRDVPESQYEFHPTLKHKAGMKHGDAFHYVSANTDVLGWLLERVTGTRFTELCSQEIWQYMGAQENAAMTVDTWGSAMACGGFNLTLRDLGRFGLMMLHEGEHNGRQIIPGSYIHDTRFKGDNLAWLNAEDDQMRKFYPQGSYHNQFWNTGNIHGAYFGVGIHGQYVYIDPKADLVIVKFSSEPTALPELMTENTLLGFETIAKALI
ncbi:MAG: beta-lactamase family protein [Desulfobacterales bacterium]|nr:beta-lactamase family protein [Desulfobacterales bacterium]